MRSRTLCALDARRYAIAGIFARIALIAACSLALASRALAAGPAGASGPIDVYVLAGQSNMGGGMPEELVPEFLAQPQDVPYQFRLQTGTAFHDTANWEQLRVLAPGYVGTNWGLELAFGHAVLERSPVPIAIIKVAANGTNLWEEWNVHTEGQWYDSLVEKVSTSLEQLEQLDHTPNLAGVVWVQGEGDANVLERAVAYEQNLLDLAATFRADFDAPNLPFVFNELHADANRLFKAEVRQSQQNAAAIDPLLRLVNADDLALGADLIHFSADMHVAIGQRFADVFYPSADFNGDGAVDGADLSEWRSSAGSSRAGDANADAQTDGEDFLLWQRQLSPAASAAPAQAIPEPTAARSLLLAVGLGGLHWLLARNLPSPV